MQYKSDLSNMGLVNLKDIKIDAALSKEERIAEYIRQIKDPYHFICNEFTIEARFTPNGPPFHYSRLNPHPNNWMRQRKIVFPNPQIWNCYPIKGLRRAAP